MCVGEGRGEVGLVEEDNEGGGVGGQAKQYVEEGEGVGEGGVMRRWKNERRRRARMRKRKKDDRDREERRGF